MAWRKRGGVGEGGSSGSIGAIGDDKLRC